MAYDERALRGVGGWLALFVIIMAVISPLRVAFNAYAIVSDPSVTAAYGKNAQLLIAFETALNVVSILGAWYLVWRLNKVQERGTVRVVIAGIWILGVGILLVDALVVVLVGSLDLGLVMGATGVELARSLIFSTVWTAYFLRSRRVANTYSTDGSSEEVAEVFR